MDPEKIADLGRRFRQLMAEKRQTQAGRTAPDDTHSPAQPSSQGQGDALYREVMSLSYVPRRWEKPGLLDQALDALDLGKIYGWADEYEAEAEAEAEKETAAEPGSDRPRLGHQDCVIKALLRYFKTEFFTWVNAPPCARCGGETEMTGVAAPSEEERSKGAGRTEVYRCKNGGGGGCAGAQGEAETRFPRYDDPGTLLTWRRGRCGEWANCFTLCCLALGSRARWVWNAEDHVWTEVWSAQLGRWVHCDACEQAFDQPLLYAAGWGKRMSYCLAFSAADGARDVTRRYVRRPEHALPRDRGPEESLRRAIQDVNDRCRAPTDAARLAREDEAEERELAGYLAEPTTTAPGEERPRESGSTDWKEARGEMGK